MASKEDPRKVAAHMTQSFMGIAVVLFLSSLLFAYVFSTRADQSGQEACRYQRAVYPSALQFRVQMVALARLVYLDAMTAGRTKQAAEAYKLWHGIRLPTAPTCRE